MARRGDLDGFAAEHGVHIVAISDLIAYRRRSERLVVRGATTTLPIDEGVVTIHAYEDVITGATHVALCWGEIADGEPVLVRVHSECLTGDVFGSQRCDCRAQLDRALRLRRTGPYQLQAAIASLHCEEEVDWPQIAALYAELMRIMPSPVVELNRAVAVAMADGPLRALALLERMEDRETLAKYYPYHVARADFLRRAGRFEEAREAYRRALELCQNRAELSFLHRRLSELPELPDESLRR